MASKICKLNRLWVTVEYLNISVACDVISRNEGLLAKQMRNSVLDISIGICCCCKREKEKVRIRKETPEKPTF